MECLVFFYLVGWTAVLSWLLARAIFPQLKVLTFCIGLAGSPDVLAARKVAEFCNTEHYEYTFTVEEGLAAIPAVVKA